MVFQNRGYTNYDESLQQRAHRLKADMSDLRDALKDPQRKRKWERHIETVDLLLIKAYGGNE